MNSLRNGVVKPMIKPIVVDASALLALLGNEPGSAVVAEAIENGAVMSMVNAAEVNGKLADAGVPENVAKEIIVGLGLEFVDFDMDLAHTVGQLKSVTHKYGLSLGDRACLALAMKLDTLALTADRAWLKCNLSVKVLFIRE
jgi:ribonuclease VapC